MTESLGQYVAAMDQEHWDATGNTVVIIKFANQRTPGYNIVSPMK